MTLLDPVEEGCREHGRCDSGAVIGERDRSRDEGLTERTTERMNGRRDDKIRAYDEEHMVSDLPIALSVGPRVSGTFLIPPATGSGAECARLRVSAQSGLSDDDDEVVRLGTHSGFEHPHRTCHSHRLAIQLQSQHLRTPSDRFSSIDPRNPAIADGRAGGRADRPDITTTGLPLRGHLD